MAAPAVAQTVLDDFSTDKFSTDYVQKSVSPFTNHGWSVTGGQLQPDSVAAGGYSAFVWTSNSLANAGDWMSIDVSVDSSASDHNGGLSVWKSIDAGTSDRAVEPRVSFNSTYGFVGDTWSSSVASESVTGPLTLKVTLNGHDASDTFITASLSNAGGLIDTHDFTISGFTGPIFVGPSAWQASAGNVAFDNLTYYSASAVPEPSTYAALVGAAALGAAAWRRRRSNSARSASLAS